MGTEFHFDTRIRRCYVPLITQQHRLHHLHNIALRNLSLPSHTADCDSKTGLHFTLHDNCVSPACYKSEVIYNSQNPSWKSFEVSSFPDNVNKTISYITVKVWYHKNDEVFCLTEWTVHFSGLSYIGEQIPKEGKNFKSNTLLFGMLEGYYGSRDSFQHWQDEEKWENPGYYMEVDPSIVHTSYSVNTLRRIRTVERAIVQTQASVQRIRAKIEERLKSTGNLQLLQSEIELLKLKISMLRAELCTQCKRIEKLRQQKRNLDQLGEGKRSDLLDRLQQLQKDKEKLIEMQKYHTESRENLLKTNAKLLFRQKQLISELSDIYPMVQFPDKKSFSICGVFLPDSEDFAGRDEKMLSVALGYVCHIISMMSHFLNVPLRYPVHHFGSRSTIIDHITDKISIKEREFPLYAKGKSQMHFKYGVYLLNKNIAQLRHYFNLSTQDLRATLPNLHSLIELKLNVHSEQLVGIPASLLYLPPSNVSLTSSYSASLQTDSGVQTFPNDSFGVELSTNTTNETLSDKENTHSQMMEELKKEMEEMIPKNAPEENIPPKLTGVDINSANLSCSLDKGLNDIKTFNQLQAKNWNNNNIESGRLKSKIRTLGQGHYHSSVPNLAASMSHSSLEEEALSSGDEKQHRPPPLAVWTMGGSRNNSDEEQAQDKSSNVEIDSEKWKENISGLHESNFIPQCDDDSYDQCKQKLLDLTESAFSTDLTTRTSQLAMRTGSFQLQRNRTSTSSSLEMD
ncbi:UV radiation resistance-associated protein [Centruroides vittatus]|uniref:UV radiation resistance-associated protein n=1 Tax=Centruroides vittatus TaxID=120091 RepID=UPI00350F8507